MERLKIGDNVYVLTQTCESCPEQYNVTRGGEQVGYLRLRHGRFTVEIPDVGGRLVYDARPLGDGAFDDDEREGYLKHAVEAIHSLTEAADIGS